MTENYRTRTSDLLFTDLCNQIDDLKDEVEHWKGKYIEERELNIKQLNESIEDGKKAMGNALMFALSVKDMPDGSLVINSEDRKSLAEQYK